MTQLPPLPRLSISVAHLPGQREQGCAELMATLLRQVEPGVVLARIDDPEPDADRQTWRTARSAWNWHRTTHADHCLALQDDAIVCRNFIRAVLLTTRLAKGVPVSYFTMHGRHVAAADALGMPWWSSPPRFSGLAAHLPRIYLNAFLNWIDQVEPDPAWRTHDDLRLTAFMRLIGHRVWSTIPSLVEHRLPSGSLVGHNNRTRVAARYIGDADPMLIDWKRTPRR
jgi:hypothetical protein